VNITIVPFLNSSGEITGYVSVAYDITESKKNKEAVIQSMKMASLGEMASGIAHEINNPLTVVIGNAELLKKLNEDKNNDPVLSEKYCTRILSSAQRATKIVRGLKTFARMADNDPFVEFDLMSAVEGTFDLLQEKFTKSDINLKIEPIPAMVIYGRLVQIEQVLVNLLGNSFDVSFFPKKERFSNADESRITKQAISF
jgi:C4-dicarboxylate-specific signal transduction histidine kinase